MTAKIIEGKAIANKLRAEYHGRVHQLASQHEITPGLTVILVGYSPFA
jgi:methylenetetrahydrofolate dehydrogenase (NADP+) / methenyltetrahydrofolate cyclohydrolase